MKIAVLYFLHAVLLVSMSASTPCTRSVTRYTTAYRVTYTYQSYRCGWLNRRRCYRRVSTARSYSRSYSVQICCSGYGPLSKGCPPICSGGCGVNKECTAPQTCTCIQGWTGQNCLTDINECADRPGLCEVYCNNTKGSYVCHCPPNNVLARDGYKCLDAVQDISSGAISSHSIGLTWKAPTNHNDDGAFRHYTIRCVDQVTEYYQMHGSGSWITPGYTSVLTRTTTMTIVSGLQPFTNYTCCITPHWLTNGAGPETCVSTVTQQDAPAGPPVNVRVTNASSYSVLVQWFPPKVPNGIITHYFIYINYNNGTHHKRQVDAEISLYLLEELRPHQIVGIRISAGTIAGEGPLSVEKSTRTNETVPSTINDLSVTITSRTSATITWSPPHALNGIIKTYHITLTKQTSKQTLIVEWIIGPDSEFAHPITFLEPFVPYQISVTAATSVGKGEISPITFFTEEGVPAVAPTFTEVTRQSNTNITVQWKLLTLEESRGFISNYYVAFGTEQTCSQQEPQRWQLGYNTTATQSSLSVSLDPQQSYCVAVAALTKAGMGNFSISIVPPEVTPTPVVTSISVTAPTPTAQGSTMLPGMVAMGFFLALLLLLNTAVIGVIVYWKLKKSHRTKLLCLHCSRKEAVAPPTTNPIYQDDHKCNEEDGNDHDDKELDKGSKTLGAAPSPTSGDIYESLRDSGKKPET